MKYKVSKIRQAALKQTAWTDRTIFICSLFSVIVFPIIEGVTIQKFHNKEWFVFCIIAIGFAHFLIGLITILNTKTLPQFAVEYTALEEIYQKVSFERDEFQRLLKQSNYVIEVISHSLFAFIDITKREKRFTKEDVRSNVEAILRPLIDLRSEVLNFSSAQARYNFAVYLYNENQNRLNVFFRVCDDRIEQTNRSWEPGTGHVGICYKKEAIIISPDIYKAPELWKDVKDSDKENYRSMASIPIFTDSDEIRGVLVITSSFSDQFSEDEHEVLFNSLSYILTLYFKHVDDYLVEGESYV